MGGAAPAGPSTRHAVLDLTQELFLLGNECWQVGVLPLTGGSLAFGRVRVGEEWLDLLRPTPEGVRWSAGDCANFPLVPWSNRVRDAVLRYGGRSYTLRRTMDDGTAIHGAAWEYPWTVAEVSGGHIRLAFASTDFVGVNYPWRFSASLEYRLDGNRLDIVTGVRNEDSVPIPVGFGHHPYFRRTLTEGGGSTPDSAMSGSATPGSATPDDAVRLEVPCRRYFELDRCLPSAPAVPVTPRVDFRRLRPLGEEFVDDCLTARDTEAPIRMVYPASGVEVAFTADEVFSNVVVYIPEGRDFFAVEPVTNVNDAFTLHENGVPGSGLMVLEPGQYREGTMSLQVALPVA